MSWWALLTLLWPLWLQHRPEEQTPLWGRRSLILLIGLLMLRYLHWRVTASLNLSTPLTTSLSLGLLLAEAWLLLTSLIALGLAWRPCPDRSSEMHTVRQQWRSSSWRPQVDLFVPTYGEPLEVLERSLLGCTNQSYPHTTVWVLDDSGRASVQHLAQRLGCRYVHRPQRLHAKAGNLNHGLNQSHAELVAVIDADFIPQRDFLINCIGFLVDPDVGLLQTPQCFLNADPVMRNLGMEPWLLSDEESFYRWIQPMRDAWGAVVCAGTSFVVKRSALESVGGFVEEALSEDFVTGVALRAQGWQLRYLPQKLSAGLAAETMLDFVRQRQRWAEGTLQSLGLAQGPLRSPGLSLGERMAYLEGAVHWFNNLPRLLLLIMPLSYGLLDVVPILMRWQDARDQLLPLWGVLLLSVGWINRRSRGALISELTSWVLTVPLSVTLLRHGFQMLRGHSSSGFRITPKHQRRDRGSCSAQLVLPLTGLTLITLLNLWGLATPAAHSTPIALAGRPIGVLWGCLNLISLLIALRACWDPPVSDPAPWQQITLAAWLDDNGGSRWPCTVEAISENGVELRLPEPLPPHIDTTQLHWVSGMAGLPVKLSLHRGQRLAMTWHNLNNQQRQALILWLYGRPGCWPDRTAKQEWRALLVLISRIVKPAPAPAPLARSLMRQQVS